MVTNTQPLGRPSAWLPMPALAMWVQITTEFPGLTEASRGKVEIAAGIRGRMACAERVKTSEISLLNRVLDELAVASAKAEPEDPDTDMDRKD